MAPEDWQELSSDSRFTWRKVPHPQTGESKSGPNHDFPDGPPTNIWGRLNAFHRRRQRGRFIAVIMLIVFAAVGLLK